MVGWILCRWEGESCWEGDPDSVIQIVLSVRMHGRTRAFTSERAHAMDDFRRVTTLHTSRDFKLLGETLWCNQHITSLDLSSTGIQTEAAKELAKVIARPHGTLLSLNLSRYAHVSVAVSASVLGRGVGAVGPL